MTTFKTNDEFLAEIAKAEPVPERPEPSPGIRALLCRLERRSRPATLERP